MKYIPIVAQVLILVTLLLSAAAMMTGFMAVPKDIETRAALYALAGIFLTILDPKSLQNKKESRNEKPPDDTRDRPVV